MASIIVENVTKRYGKTIAVDNVSFEVEPGRVLGLLGPNGAGKTSTIRMIAFITMPDEGRVLFDEKPVGSWSQERMGYLPIVGGRATARCAGIAHAQSIGWGF